MATVRIPTVLRKHTDGQSKVQAEGATVGEVFRHIVAEHPDLQDKLFDGDKVRGFINVYVEDEDIRYLDGLDSKVQDGDEIAIMPAVWRGRGLECASTTSPRRSATRRWSGCRTCRPRATGSTSSSRGTTPRAR